MLHGENMAKFTSHVWSDIRGSISGTVYSRNRFGLYTRRRVAPINPRTAAQSLRRELLAALAANWRNLDPAFQDGWRALAERFAASDSLGQNIRLTGTQLYVGLNARRILVGLPRLDEPPPDIGTPPTLSSVILTVDSTAPDMNISFTPTPLVGAIVIEGAAPVSAGVNFVGRNKFRLLKTARPANPGATITSPIQFSSEYIQRFGVPPIGSKVFIRVIPVSFATAETAGFAGTPVVVSRVVLS